MKPVTGTRPGAITRPAEAKARAVRRGPNPAPCSAYPDATITEDLDGAGKPGSDDGTVQYAHQPNRREAEKDERAGG